jgi:hypothetical protein
VQVEERVEQYRTVSTISAITEAVPWRLERRVYRRTSARRHEPPPNSLWSAERRPRGSDAMHLIWGTRAAGSTQVGCMPSFLVDLALTPLVTALELDAASAQRIRTAQPLSAADPRLQKYTFRTTDPGSMQQLLDAAGERLAANTHDFVIAVVTADSVRIQVAGYVDAPQAIDELARLGVGLVKAAGQL